MRDLNDFFKAGLGDMTRTTLLRDYSEPNRVSHLIETGVLRTVQLISDSKKFLIFAPMDVKPWINDNPDPIVRHVNLSLGLVETEYIEPFLDFYYFYRK